ncbi:MAG: hypothetical protein VYA30_14760 [Myxococcota bacterium]|nr:hypothetical protein [Myxococcota bacterium]
MLTFKSRICQRQQVRRSAILLFVTSALIACTNQSIRTPRSQSSGVQEPIRSIDTYPNGQCPIRADSSRYSVTLFSDGIRIEGFRRVSIDPIWVQRIEFARAGSKGPDIERLQTLLKECRLSSSSHKQLTRWVHHANRGHQLSRTDQSQLGRSLAVDFARYADGFGTAQNRLGTLLKKCPSTIPAATKALKLAIKNCTNARKELESRDLYLDTLTRDKARATVTERITALKQELTLQNRVETLGQLCKPDAQGQVQSTVEIEKKLATLSRLGGKESKINSKLAERCKLTRRMLKKSLTRLRDNENKMERERRRRCAKNRARIAVPMRTLVSIEYAEKIGVRLRKLSKELRSKARSAIRKKGLSDEQQQFIQCATDAFGAADDIMRGIYQMHRGRYAREWLKKGRFEEVQEEVMRRASQPGAACRGFVLGGLTRRILGPIDTYLSRVDATPNECK